MEDIFKDRGMITLIPFFAAIYLSFYGPNLILTSLVLAGCIVNLYLIVIFLAREASENKPKTEQEVYRSIIGKRNFRISGWVSIMQWVLSGITLILLFPYRKDFLAYSLFWLLIAGFIFNFLRMFVVYWDIIKKAFQGKL